MPEKSVTIRALALGGSWEQFGSGRRRGVWPENVELRANGWGSSAASFELKRDGSVPWPDLTAFTPIDVEVGGVLVWSGRVAETPTRSDDLTMTVRCEGWQAHLDDDQFERVYVHTKLSDWKDARSFPNATLSYSGTANASVQTDAGGIVLGFPNGATLAKYAHAAAVLDLGPSSTAKRIVFNVMAPARTAGAGNFGFHCRFLDYPAFSSTAIEDVYTTDITGLSTTTPTTIARTAATARRYIMFFIYWAPVANGTLGEDNTVRISSCQVFADAAYESGNGSVLTADTIVKDALSRGTILLNSDTTAVQKPGGFNIPEFAPDGPRTPRAMIEAANVFHDWQTQVDVRKRLVYRPRPTVPDVRVGRWGAMTFEDSSAGSGEEIYNRVIVSGKDAGDTDVRVTRSQAQQSDVNASLDVATSFTVRNPDFAASPVTWLADGASTLTRDTTFYDSSPASLRWERPPALYGSQALGINDALALTAAGAWTSGVSYVFEIRVALGNPGGGPVTARPQFTFGDVATGDYVERYETFSTFSAWKTVRLTWTPKASGSSANIQALQIRKFDDQPYFLWIDTPIIKILGSTIVDRRGFVRTHTLDSTFTLTPTSAEKLGDTYLAAHKTTPFKGRGTVVGNSAVRAYTSGQAVPPERLLLMAGGLMHFDDRIDPDTGAVGRNGRLVEVAYRPESDQATFDVDNSRADFDALLQRAGLLVGQLG